MCKVRTLEQSQGAKKEAMKRYPMNGPTLAEQQAICYYWNSPSYARQLIRNYAR